MPQTDTQISSFEHLNVRRYCETFEHGPAVTTTTALLTLALRGVWASRDARLMAQAESKRRNAETGKKVHYVSVMPRETRTREAARLWNWKQGRGGSKNKCPSISQKERERTKNMVRYIHTRPVSTLYVFTS